MPWHIKWLCDIYLIPTGLSIVASLWFLWLWLEDFDRRLTVCHLEGSTFFAGLIILGFLWCLGRCYVDSQIYGVHLLWLLFQFCHQCTVWLVWEWSVLRSLIDAVFTTLVVFLCYCHGGKYSGVGLRPLWAVPTWGQQCLGFYFPYFFKQWQQQKQ